MEKNKQIKVIAYIGCDRTALKSSKLKILDFHFETSYKPCKQLRAQKIVKNTSIQINQLRILT